MRTDYDHGGRGGIDGQQDFRCRFGSSLRSLANLEPTLTATQGTQDRSHREVKTFQASVAETAAAEKTRSRTAKANTRGTSGAADSEPKQTMQAPGVAAS